MHHTITNIALLKDFLLIHEVVSLTLISNCANK